MSRFEHDDVEHLRAALAALADEEQWPEPDLERIYAALHGDLDVVQRRRVVEELAHNPRAALAWRLAHDIAPDTVGAAAVHALHLGPTRPGSWLWLAAAASVLLVAGLGVFLRLPEREVPAYRGTDERRIESQLRPDVPLTRAAPVLRWTQVDGARYRVRVLTSELALLEEAEDLTTAEHRVADTTLRRLRAGDRLLWQVEARVPGRAPITSPTFTARVE